MDRAPPPCAEKAAKRAEKQRAKEIAEKVKKNEWIPIEGLWAAYSIEGRGHREGPFYGRKYRVDIPLEDFGDHLYLGGMARFTDGDGGDLYVFHLPVQAKMALSFEFKINPHDIGGSTILIGGLEVRAPQA